MRTAKTTSIVVLVVATLVLPQVRSNTKTKSTSEITLHEAEILVYVLPEARQIRSEGMDVAWTLQTSSKLNQRDFYTFWVVNAKRMNVHGSLTVGFFSVDKHTAEVVDDLGRRIEDAELQGVQRILRDAHAIDSKTLRDHESDDPNTVPGTDNPQ